MFKSLRNRLILSHILPLIIIVPLMGLMLIYTLETQYVIPTLLRNLQNESELLTVIIQSYPQIWNDPFLASALLNRINPGRTERVMLITTDGYLLASTDTGDSGQIGYPIDVPGINDVVQGHTIINEYYSLRMEGEVIDLIVPVLDPYGEVVSVLRLTDQYQTFYEEFVGFRYLILGILSLGLVIGVTLGSLIALNINRPLRNVTEAVYELARGRRTEPLAEVGVTEVRQLARAANHLVDRLRNLEESRRKLLANLVHELGRPLGALRAAIQALKRGATTDPKLLTELLEGMEDETVLLQRLTDDLAHLHDQVLGSLELEMREIALEEWLPPILRSWQVAAQDKRLSWSENLPADQITLQADPDRLAQALGNLISNAIKYTPSGGHIAVSAGSTEGQAWISVTDDGPGIPPNEQEKIFTPYFRGSHGKRFPQGMGLGLTIAKDLIDAQGGDIELESTPGLGSKFTIHLPIRSN
jgi:two-component system sensor histidine kinase BaeS